MNGKRTVRRAAAMVVAGLICQTALAASLYKAGSYRPLTSDLRSYAVGDALTVLIVENSSAQSEADSTATRDLSIDGGSHGIVHQNAFGAELKRGSSGKGETNRTGSLQATVSVRVQEVAANGDLVVHGVQRITVNGETQTISVSGVARPVDISADNVVLSSRLTNADIRYTGKGFVDRSQREGWISRIFSWLGL
jgi:flagellar L-ring protein precursor FlgH